MFAAAAAVELSVVVVVVAVVVGKGVVVAAAVVDNLQGSETVGTVHLPAAVNNNKQLSI